MIYRAALSISQMYAVGLDRVAAIERHRRELLDRHFSKTMTQADWRDSPINEWPVPIHWRPICGAKCRDGHSCQRRAIEGHWRCANHGGKSNGPRTVEGKATIAASNRTKEARKAAIAATYQAKADRERREIEVEWRNNGPAKEADLRRNLAAYGFSPNLIDHTIAKLDTVQTP
jgi:hypothetical protein